MSAKILSFNLLDMPTVSHNNYGLWRVPGNRKLDYRKISYWRDLARACERALFDTHFLADVMGIAEGFGGTPDVALREGMHVPNLDPFTLISAMAAVTRHVGFAVTASTTFEHPFSLARRFSSLDHFTKGRIGFNAVTSYLPAAAANFGLSFSDEGHDARYDRADEFMEVCRKLWETSWQDDAVVKDIANATYAEPSRVHRIDHHGRHFDVAGPHLCEPSIQRTPVIFQAGSSGRGMKFAAQHAEVVFVGGRSLETVRDNVRALRQAVIDAGRPPESLKIMAMYSFVTGETAEIAQAKKAFFDSSTSAEGYIAHNTGSGFDLSRYPRDALVAEIIEEDGPGAAHMRRYPFDEGTTVGDIFDQYRTVDQAMPFVCGTGEQVADHIESCADMLDVDGFLLRQVLSPETVVDFADFVMPVLQRRGRYRTAYEGQSLRDNLFGAGNRRAACFGAAQ